MPDSRIIDGTFDQNRFYGEPVCMIQVDHANGGVDSMPYEAERKDGPEVGGELACVRGGGRIKPCV